MVTGGLHCGLRTVSLRRTMNLASSTSRYGMYAGFMSSTGLTRRVECSFFERIAKTYRRESWEPLLHPLLSQWYKCAQQLGDVDLSVRLLVEMLGYGANASPDDPDALQDDLLAVLQVRDAHIRYEYLAKQALLCVAFRALYRPSRMSP